MRIALFIIVILCLVGMVWQWAGGKHVAPPPPPVADALDTQDEDVQKLVRDSIKRVEQSPLSSDERLRLGMSYDANGMVASAATCYEQAIELNPDNAKAHYYLGLIRAGEGRVDEAIEHVRKVIQAVGDTYAPARWRIGHWLMDEGEVASAKTEYERATAIDPNDPGGWYGLARVAIEEGRFSAAADIARSRIAANVEDAYAHYLLGTALMRLGQEAEARVALARGTGGSPEGFDPRVYELYQQRVGLVAAKELSGQLCAQRRRAEIVPLLEPYREAHTDDTVVATNLATGYVEVGRYDDAIELLTKAVEYNPNHFALRVVFAEAYRHQHDFVNALAQANRAVELNADLPQAHTGLGKVLTDMGRYESAIEAYETAAKLDPTDAATQVQLAGLYAQLQRWEEAEAALDRADALQPGNQQIQTLKMRLQAGKEQVGG